MKRTVGSFREKPVGRNRFEDVRRLCGNDDIMETLVFKQLQVTERRSHKRLGNVDLPSVKFFAQALLKRAEVHANANRDLLFLRRAGDGLDPVARADVAGIEAQRVCSRLYGGERAAVVEVDVGNKRKRRRLFYFAENFRRFDVGNSQAKDVATKRRARANLLDERRRVVGAYVRHGLYANRRSTADCKRADLNCSCCSSHS